MRAVTFLAIGAVLAPSFMTPAIAVAQPGRNAVDACSMAIRYQVQDQYPQARGVRVTSSDQRDGYRNETIVTGRGEFDDRNGGEAKFTYGCTYNFRNGRTSNLQISDVSHKDGKSNGAAVAGLVLGAIVLGAIAANASKDKDKDRDDWRHDEIWSPADGVRCNARERSCYKDGRYSDKWTKRTFYR